LLHVKKKKTKAFRDIHTPAIFVTGIGSPVKLDSSTVLLPALTIPSAGMRSCMVSK